VSTHIGAAPGDVAPRVLLPGDPLRAKWIAETFLDGAECYSTVRNMLGFTGRYRGESVSVQGTGMGLPSLSIYVNELIRDYDARQLVRVGTCGALTGDLALRDVVLAISASTDSSMNRVRFEGLDFAPSADFALLRTAYDVSLTRGVDIKVVPVFSADSLYSDRPELLARITGFGVRAVEMEASALYTLAAQHRRRALAICTVSDHLETGEHTTAAERETTFGQMVEIALETMIAVPERPGG
jgi:purine-nucleoside phosphorylase